MILQGNQGSTGKTLGQGVTQGYGEFSDCLATDLQPRYYELNYRGQIFTASQPAAGSGALAAGNVSPVAAAAIALFAIYNPVGSKVNLVILRTIIALIAGTPGGAFVWNVIPSPAGITAAANIVPINNSTFANTGSIAKVYSQTALTGSLISSMLRPIGGQAAIAAGAGVNSIQEETAGDIIVPPGACLIIALTALGTTPTCSCGVTWAEVAV